MTHEPDERQLSIALPSAQCVRDLKDVDEGGIHNSAAEITAALRAERPTTKYAQ